MKIYKKLILIIFHKELTKLRSLKRKYYKKNMKDPLIVKNRK